MQMKRENKVNGLYWYQYSDCDILLQFFKRLTLCEIFAIDLYYFLQLHINLQLSQYKI
jgi:hypothetical protein